MSRRIVTSQLQAGGGVAPDGYFDKVLKYIPADVNAGWVAVTTLVGAVAGDTAKAAVMWAVFVAFVVITAGWTLRQTSQPGQPPAATQVLVATGAFIVWAAALGAPFVTLPGYQPIYGSVVLIIYTLVVGMINPPEEARSARSAHQRAGVATR